MQFRRNAPLDPAQITDRRAEAGPSILGNLARHLGTEIQHPTVPRRRDRPVSGPNAQNRQKVIALVAQQVMRDRPR